MIVWTVRIRSKHNGREYFVGEFKTKDEATKAVSCLRSENNTCEAVPVDSGNLKQQYKYKQQHEHD